MSCINDNSNFTYEVRLAEIRKIKMEHTLQKRKIGGPRDNDDYGQVPRTQNFIFQPETNHPKGYILGARDCGHNFRCLLETMPVYFNKYSSLLGGYSEQFLNIATRWDPDDYWVELMKDHKRYNIIHGIINSHHFSVDVELGLKAGFKGLLEKIYYYKGIREPITPGLDEGMIDVVIGIQTWIRRHVESAREFAALEQNPIIRNHLIELAAMNERIIDNPPSTFHEACQWIAWYQMAARVYNGSGALGRLDQMLIPYYSKDKKLGILTDKEAVFHLCCLNVCDPQYIQVGGVDKKGNDTTNKVSFLILEAVQKLAIPANVAVAVHEKMDGKLFDKAVEVLVKGKLGIPRFFGLDAVVEGYVKNGVPVEDARLRVQTGCHWSNIPGREYSLSDVIKINFAAVLNEALYEMMSDSTVKPSVEKLWNLFGSHLRRAVDITARGIDIHMQKKHLYFPELVLDLLCHGVIEKGEDATHGALEYNTICVDGSGLATVADSFGVLETCIEKEQRFTWHEVMMYIDRNFLLAEKERQIMLNVPGFGRGGTSGDRWAKKVVELFVSIVKEKKTPCGFDMVPGLFSWASTIPMGKVVGATPNGRKAGEPISFGANPDPGPGRGGSLTPTALACAVAEVQPGYGNAAPLQIDFDLGTVSNQEGIECIKALIRGHFLMGGTLINANILDKDKIYDAYHNPEKYPDLIVRVTGFSAYFASLSKEFRKLVYDRIISL